MYKRIESIVFCMIFLIGLSLPAVRINFQPGRVSKTENRALANPAKLYNDDGTKNTNFKRDFENWFNDSIGMRAALARTDGKIQYYLFHQLKDMPLGTNGVLAPYQDLADLQHRNLYTEEQLDSIADAYQTVYTYLSARGIPMLFMQCWDKQTIYPEQYPDTIQVFGDVSRTQQVEEAVKQKTDVPVVSLMQLLKQAKEKYMVYPEWSDPWHWTMRGSFIAYQELMKNICTVTQKQYRVLQENDFDLTPIDTGKTFFESIHREEMTEAFAVKNVTWRDMPQKLTYMPADIYAHHIRYIENPAADNEDTLLILGDSYIHDSMILQGLCSAFHTVVMYNGAAVADRNFLHMVEEYDPDLVLFEQAERESQIRYAGVVSAAQYLHAQAYEPGTVIRFYGEDNNSLQYVLNGMSAPDEPYTWTVGARSTLYMTMDVPEGTPLCMHIRTEDAYGGRQRVIVRINRQKVYEGIVEGKQELEIPFVMSAIHGLSFRLEYPDAISPFENKDSVDIRPLSLAIREMEIVKAQ